MAVRHYKELIAWQKAMDLVVAVYGLTAAFPSDERFGLSNQLRRAAVSIPSNIAEGQGKQTTKEFVYFLTHARGSLQEVETQLLLAERLNYVQPPHSDAVLTSVAEVGRLINGLIGSLRSD